MTSEVSREEFNNLLKKVVRLEKTSGKLPKSLRKKRAPSEYNLFIGKKIKEIKKNTPDIGHTDAFSKAVKLWKKEKGK